MKLLLSVLVICGIFVCGQCVINTLTNTPSAKIGVAIPKCAHPTVWTKLASFRCFWPQCKKSEFPCLGQESQAGEALIRKIVIKPGCVCKKGYAYINETTCIKANSRKCNEGNGDKGYKWTLPNSQSTKTDPQTGMITTIHTDEHGIVTAKASASGPPPKAAPRPAPASEPIMSNPLAPAPTPAVPGADDNNQMHIM